MNKLTIKQYSILKILLAFLYSGIAYSQGPNAPEAGSFEPVDATDMVNLMTGDLSYVLPLLNVPSPEGGYPVALAYHAGIAMDQEASWVGLGWNLNPGAINRNINLYPDDYKRAFINEYFYDKGGEVVVNALSLGYSNGGASVGLGFSWGSHRALGGSVSFGIGLKFGDATVGYSISGDRNGASGSLGYTSPSGLSLGVSASTNGSYGVSIGNASGFRMGANSDGGYSFSLSKGINNDNLLSVGFNLSSSGVGFKGTVTNRNNNNVDGGIGVGLNLAHSSSISMGDYTTNTSNFTIPVVLPTPVGVFSLSFGKQKYEYFASQNKGRPFYGPLYFHEYFGSSPSSTGIGTMEMYEFSTSSNKFDQETRIGEHNAAFPSFDNFQVQAQGLSGSMRIHLQENGELFGLFENGVQYGYSSSTISPHRKFGTKPSFYFDNEISSYLNVSKANFFNNPSAQNIYHNYWDGVVDSQTDKRTTSKYIEYFTNDEIHNDFLIVKAKGYLHPNATGFSSRITQPSSGIGAYTITAADGKKYHYSLPVYNHEIITRSYGYNLERPDENQSYKEKRQLTPYATHWLLTAVTGPDYVDSNNNGYADENDFGYWVSFEYGKWSSSYVWKAPYGKDVIEADHNEPTLDRSKTWIRGRKELYYLDMIKTRTHSALFVKEERLDARSDEWEYKSVEHINGENQNEDDYVTRFNIPVNNQLGLKKIILVKNEDQLVNKNHGPNSSSLVNIYYPTQPGYPTKNESAHYHLSDNVIDWNDNWQDVIDNALKVIDFEKDYSLVNNAPNSLTGKSTLKKVHFKGKGSLSVLPSYVFDYINNLSYTFNIEDQDQYGYYKNNNSLWSLNKITMPEGSKIEIEYEPKKLKPRKSEFISFKDSGSSSYGFKANIQSLQNNLFTIETFDDYGIKIGDNWLEIVYSEEDCNGETLSDYIYTALGEVVGDLSNGSLYKYEIQGYNINVQTSTSDTNCGDGQYTGYEQLSIGYKVSNEIQAGGIVASKISASDGSKSISTDYSYGDNEDNIGIVSYIPYAQDVLKEVPYSTELPSPRVMYGTVNVRNIDNSNQSTGRTEYKFRVFPEKSESEIKFGNVFSITASIEEFNNPSIDTDIFIGSHTIYDNLASIGQLLSVKSFNKFDHLVNSTINEYYEPYDIDYDFSNNTSNYGVTKESYQTYKIVYNPFKWAVTSSSRIRFPSLLKSVTQKNSNGTFYSSFSDIDPISGEHLVTTTTNSNGQSIQTKSIPAFRIPEYSGDTNGYGMGSKANGVTNYNMLSQEAASFTFLLDSNGSGQVLNANIGTWNNDWTYRNNDGSVFNPTNHKEKIWRKHKNYVWKGEINSNGTYANYNGNYDGFNWGIGASQPDQWQAVSEATLYDHFSSQLETKDINDNFSSVKMDENHEKVLSVSNATYTEQFYSGAEEGNSGFTGGELNLGDVTALYAHTGSFSERASSGSMNFKCSPVPYLKDGQTSKKYKVSVWVHKNNYLNARLFDGQSIVQFDGEKVFAGDWVLLNHYLDLSSPSDIYVTSNSGYVYFDDFRLHPIQSNMISYVYNNWDEVTYILGGNNMATKYEYDDAGNLSKTYIEVADTPSLIGGFKLSSEFAKRYKRDITE